MEESELVFNIFYILLCYCIINPPTEFVLLGWTTENIFSKFYIEEFNFIHYHQKRTTLNILIHSSLPGIYFVLNYLKSSLNDVYILEQQFPNNPILFVAQRISIFTICFILTIIYYWSLNDWKNHPISKELLKFSNLQTQQQQQIYNYNQIIEDINNEFRRNNILKMKINSISTVIATENWIIKTTPYFVYFAHQSDCVLNVNKSDTFKIAADTNDLLQMLDIIVKPLRPNVKEFNIRINALDFKRLQDHISRPITIPENIHFHRNLIDRFIEVFKDQVSMNPIVRTNQMSDNCFACMIQEPNIKIQKHCEDIDSSGNQLSDDDCCRNCYCRPMWCVECLSRWFVSRQNEYERDVWLQQKCTCPLCRAKFCILDVCYIEKINNDEH